MREHKTAAASEEELSRIIECPQCKTDWIKREWGPFGQLIYGCNTCCWHSTNPNPLRNKIEKLQRQNAILLDAVEFYGDPNNWLAREMWSKGEGEALAYDYSVVKHLYEGVEYQSEVGGKRARQALEKIKEQGE